MARVRTATTHGFGHRATSLDHLRLPAGQRHPLLIAMVLLVGCGRVGPTNGGGSTPDAAAVDGESEEGVDTSSDAVGDAASACHLDPRPAQLCLDGAWCQLSPQPGSTVTNGLYAAQADDVWLVGKDTVSTVVHWDGKQWTAVDPGVDDATLLDAHGTARDDVWVVGDVILHFDCARWSQVDVGLPAGTRIESVFARTRDDVWLAGETPDGNAIVAHLAGGTWAVQPRGIDAYAKIFATAADDAWALKRPKSPRGVRVDHWNGTAWSPVDGLDAFVDEVRAIAGTAPDDVWVLGASAGRPVLLHGGLASWSPVPTSFDGLLSAQIAVGAPNDVWFYSEWRLKHWDGTAVTEVTAPIAPVASAIDHLSVASDGSLFTLGAFDGVFRRDGTSWRDLRPPRPPTYGPIGGTADDDVWVARADPASHQFVFDHFDGSTWTTMDSGGKHDFNAASFATRDDGWLVGFGGESVHWDGRRWMHVDVPPGFEKLNLASVWASPGVAFAVGEGMLEATSGSWRATTASPPPGALRTVWGASPDDVWVGGDSGGVLHFDGSAWSSPYRAPFEVGAIGGSAADDVWFGGTFADDTGIYGKLVHFDGSHFVAVSASLGSSQPRRIFARSREDVFLFAVVTDGSTDRLFHFDGMTWSPVPRPARFDAMFGGADRVGDAVYFGGPRVVRYRP